MHNDIQHVQGIQKITNKLIILCILCTVYSTVHVHEFKVVVLYILQGVSVSLAMSQSFWWVVLAS